MPVCVQCLPQRNDVADCEPGGRARTRCEIKRLPPDRNTLHPDTDGSGIFSSTSHDITHTHHHQHTHTRTRTCTHTRHRHHIKSHHIAPTTPPPSPAPEPPSPSPAPKQEKMATTAKMWVRLLVPDAYVIHCEVVLSLDTVSPSGHVLCRICLATKAREHGAVANDFQIV